MVDTPNKVLLKGDEGRLFEEFRSVAGTIKPGYLLEVTSAGKVQPHSDFGGAAPGLMFAKEEGLLGYSDPIGGRQTWDAFATDAVVPVHCALPGEVLYCWVPAYAPALVQGNSLISNGDGRFTKLPTSGGSVLFAATAASTALNTHTTITAFDVAYTIPANTLAVGDILRIKAAVLFANASNSTETSVITLKVGGLTIVATAALDHAAADVALLDVIVHVRAIGASGSVVALGTQSAGPPASATMKPFYTAAQTLDTTATAAVTVSQTNSASHANTGGQLVDLLVEKLGTTGGGQVLATVEEAVDNSAVATEGRVKIRVA